ncbi:flagellar basal body P-ring protein FlgI [Aquisalimonas lutea]|uniref:flagellar basal body P-ring protein FlgI n=1 Tax=Aquisalimonas lutea TaxID=1327750 RepID=UPI0025B3DC08|nr:flagellar basal body P-ring protein FlgI [Aquisalimonas lutea]MDN3517988.1 flagellar basal body P-ring protein FlgI [Aquisalimonas lutea]
MLRMPLIALIALVLGANAGSLHAQDWTGERIKDLAEVAGVRDNQLVGYGLVVGLDGTGDQTTQAPFTAQSIRSMLSSQGVQVPPDVSFQTENVAAVMVTANLPAFARPGQDIDVTVASIANAESLRGGSLLMTPLRGADGEIYAMAQGNLTVSGFGVGGEDGSSITVNIPSAGRIPGGATVEQEVASPFNSGDTIELTLNTPDFTTARRMADAINEELGPETARAKDAGAVSVRAPDDPDQRVGFMAYLEKIRVHPGAAPAKVIVNSRSGTVVVGSEVRVRQAAVTHGSLTVTITEDFDVDQPPPFGEGETVVTPDTDIEVQQEDNPMFLFGPGVRLEEIVEQVNRVGAAPGDLVAILEALKQAGALRAELVII